MKPAPSNMQVPEVTKINFKSLSNVNRSLQMLSVQCHNPQKQCRNKYM
jgi:hypothetical protein